MNILISSCLLGQQCRYDGAVKTYAAVEALLAHEEIHVIPFCPEQGGGLSTPRPAAERRGERVVTAAAADVTAAYQRGAAEALKLAIRFRCVAALLKEKSPSCGSGAIYDGTFTRTLRAGDGVTAERLKQAGIPVYGESRAAEIMDLLSSHVFTS